MRLDALLTQALAGKRLVSLEFGFNEPGTSREFEPGTLIEQVRLGKDADGDPILHLKLQGHELGDEYLYAYDNEQVHLITKDGDHVDPVIIDRARFRNLLKCQHELTLIKQEWVNIKPIDVYEREVDAGIHDPEHEGLSGEGGIL